MLALLLALLPQVVLPRPQDLQAAQHDDVELGRLGCRLGPARLLRIAAQGSAAPQRALALRALGLCGADDSLVAMQGLPPLVELIGRAGDERLLAAASRAALLLGQRLGRAVLDGDEDSGDELPRAAAALLRLGGDRTLPEELRAELVAAATALPRRLWPQAALQPLGRSPDRPVRQAALLALAGGGPAGEAEILRLAEEADPEVAIDAAAALCEVPVVPTPQLGERVRQLAGPQGGAASELRQKLAPCLRRLGTPADRALLLALGRGKKGAR